MEERFNSKLLVEGKDDLHVIIQLCASFNIKKTFDVIDSEGVENAMERFPLRIKSSGINCVGLIVDADVDMLARWALIRNKLLVAGYHNVPNDMPVDGLIISDAGLPKFGLWLMPDNNTNGMLEDFIRFLVPDNDALMPIAEEVITNMESQNHHRYKTRAKALIHTWLAWQEDPGTPLGQSITKKYLDTEHEKCLKLINWLKELFKDS